MVCLEPKPSQDGGPGLAGTFLFPGKVPGRLGLSVPSCKMSGLDRSCVPRRCLGREPWAGKSSVPLPGQVSLLLEITPWTAAGGRRAHFFEAGFGDWFFLQDGVNN